MLKMKPRISKALHAMAALGISHEETKTALKRLYILYDKNWEFIEAESYRALVDAIFEDKKQGAEAAAEKKEAKPKVNGKSFRHLQTDNIQSEPKKLCLTPQEDNSSRRVNMNNHQETPMSPAVKVESCFIDLEDESAASVSSEKEKEKESIYNGKQDPGRKAGYICTTSGQHCMDIASSKAGDVKLSLIYDGYAGQSYAFSPEMESVLQKVLSSHPSRGLLNLMEGLCESLSEVCKVSKSRPVACYVDDTMRSSPINAEGHHMNRCESANHHHNFIDDISKGKEKVKISLVDKAGKGEIPRFFYIPQNIVYQNAHVSVSLARISDEDSCPGCAGDCLSAPFPCACARETGGEFAYTPNGLLKEEFLNSCISLKREPQEHHYVYCQDCPLERVKNEMVPDPCKGHLVRRFIKECWSKCGCDMHCGNRVVQRGIARNLQVFWTPEGKGWGLRSTEELPKGAFVCEYVGEIMTNMELYERNLQNGSKRHTYPVCLDADWGSESILKDEEALCLDATIHGNVARFINHRCYDTNLLDIPVEVETLDRHYYHLAFFTTRDVQPYEELTWDYEIDFNDKNHPIEAFQCRCGSRLCRGSDRKCKGKRKILS